jgi:hypothetical protein
MTSAAFVATSGGDFVAVGIPSAQVGSVTTGKVELHAFDRTTGEITATAAETLTDAQPDSNEAFGRALAAMSFGGNDILVVAASNEVFSYFRTQVYGDTR